MNRAPENDNKNGKREAKLRALLLWLALLVLLVPAIREQVAAWTAAFRDAGPSGQLGFVGLYILATTHFFPRSLANALAR
ncbi:MAG: hypothetical protein CSA62_11400 [Planctomycetota bacterium]|nr:MAG: hypothetical protein CSA62_11400 [Planctomycetota bacterium]